MKFIALKSNVIRLSGACGFLADRIRVCSSFNAASSNSNWSSGFRRILLKHLVRSRLKFAILDDEKYSRIPYNVSGKYLGSIGRPNSFNSSPSASPFRTTDFLRFNVARIVDALLPAWDALGFTIRRWLKFSKFFESKFFQCSIIYAAVNPSWISYSIYFRKKSRNRSS